MKHTVNILEPNNENQKVAVKAFSSIQKNKIKENPGILVSAGINKLLELLNLDKKQIPINLFKGTTSIVTAIARGEIESKLAEWIDEIYTKGEIDQVFFRDTIGRDSLDELFETATSTKSDSARLSAMKAIYKSIVAKNSDQQLRLRRCELLMLSKKLNGRDILILKTCNEIAKQNDAMLNALTFVDEWRHTIIIKNPYMFIKWVAESDEKLCDIGFLDPPQGQMKERYNPSTTFRLTDMGISFCEVVEKYGDK